jgi:hypothetical protein
MAITNNLFVGGDGISDGSAVGASKPWPGTGSLCVITLDNPYNALCQMQCRPVRNATAVEASGPAPWQNVGGMTYGSLQRFNLFMAGYDFRVQILAPPKQGKTEFQVRSADQARNSINTELIIQSFSNGQFVGLTFETEGQFVQVGDLEKLKASRAPLFICYDPDPFIQANFGGAYELVGADYRKLHIADQQLMLASMIVGYNAYINGSRIVKDPTSVVITNVQATQATISWSQPAEHNSTASEIIVNGVVVATVTERNYTATGLTPNTGYTLGVRNINTANGRVASAIVTMDLRTAAEAIAGLTVENDGPTVRVSATAEFEGLDLAMVFLDDAGNVVDQQSETFVSGVLSYTPLNPLTIATWTASINDANGNTFTLPDEPRAFGSGATDPDLDGVQYLSVISDGPEVRVQGVSALEGRNLYLEFKNSAGEIVETIERTFDGGEVRYQTVATSSIVEWTGFAEDNGGTDYYLVGYPRFFLQSGNTLHPDNSNSGGGVASDLVKPIESLAASSVTSTSVMLNWSQPVNHNSLSRTIYRDNVVVGVVSSNQFQISGLSPSTNYQFAVANVNGSLVSSQVVISVTTSAGSGVTPPSVGIEVLDSGPVQVSVAAANSLNGRGVAFSLKREDDTDVYVSTAIVVENVARYQPPATDGIAKWSAYVEDAEGNAFTLLNQPVPFESAS